MSREAMNSFEGELGLIARKSIHIYGASFLSVLTGLIYRIIATKLVLNSTLSTAFTIVNIVSIIITLSSLSLNWLLYREYL